MATVPTFVLAANTGYVSVTVTSNAGDSFVYVLRDGIYLTKTLPVGTAVVFTDYNAPFNTVLSYQCIAIDSGGGQAAGTIQSITLPLTSGSYLHQVTKAAATNKTGTLLYIANQAGQRRDSVLADELMLMPSRTKPVIELGSIFQDKFDIPTIITLANFADTNTLHTFIKSRGVFRFRDARKNQMFGTLPPQQITLGTVSSANVLLNRTAYSENVE